MASAWPRMIDAAAPLAKLVASGQPSTRWLAESTTYTRLGETEWSTATPRGLESPAPSMRFCPKPAKVPCPSTRSAVVSVSGAS